MEDLFGYEKVLDYLCNLRKSFSNRQGKITVVRLHNNCILNANTKEERQIEENLSN